jgi:DNA polymerase III epsilon subunit-like protein
MRILVFDTETTGLPTERNPSITETNKWPYIIQLSYVVYNTEENDIVHCYDEILKVPDGVEISEESIKFHNITREINREIGINRKIAIQNFNVELQSADIIVGHNISFDKRLIMVECIRNNIQQRFNFKGNKKLEYCTMKNSVDICKIEKTGANGNKYFKYPTLSELYRKLFNEDPKNLHNSFVDVLLCLRCYGMIVYDIDLANQTSVFYELMHKFVK